MKLETEMTDGKFGKFGKFALVATIAAVTFCGAATWAADRASAPEAVAMVKKGIAFIKANGKDKGFAEITSAQSQFRDRELHLVVQQTDGTVLAHGANPKIVGKNFIEAKDVDGKFFSREIIDAAKLKNGSWTEYKYSNPVTKKVENKAMYCERLEDTILVCGGIFKN
jgi:cytochrome c